jgi:hypothetical protein
MIFDAFMHFLAPFSSELMAADVLGVNDGGQMQLGSVLHMHSCYLCRALNKEVQLK